MNSKTIWEHDEYEKEISDSEIINGEIFLSTPLKRKPVNSNKL